MAVQGHSPVRKGTMPELAGLAPSSQTVGCRILIENPGKSEFSKFTSMEKYTQLLLTANIWQSKKSAMEQHALRNVNNCLNSIIYPHLETSGGKSLNLYLNVVHFFNASDN